MVTVQQFREGYDRLAEAVNAHDLERSDQLIDMLYTPDFVHHPGASRHPRGPEGYKQILRAVFEHHPNFQMTLQDVFASGDRVVTRWVLLLTDAATGQPVERMDITIHRYE
ncbi:MAG: nuclear transport factor 2 family protein, partial [Chloroflexi bacterium]|nr:nuclear transport factor 2 family protein [Chloroflexota bacterium]